MNRTHTAPRLGTTFNDGVLGLAAVAILLVAAVVWSANSGNVERTDFALTYMAAHVVHAGTGVRLYDTAFQLKLRESMFQHASPIYFEHPPFEALALSPLAVFSFRTAHTIWGLFNVAIVLALIILLRGELPWPSEDILYLLAWLLFVPILVTLYQGQSSIVVLAGFSIAWLQLRKGNSFAAGVAFGLALLKFQFAIPLALILMFRKNWRFVGGFALAGAVLSILSFVAVGWSGMLDYIHFISRVGSNPQNVSYGAAVDMPTLLGLIYALGGRHLGTVALNGLLVLLSIALLIWIAKRWPSTANTESDGVMFAAAIAGSLLCGSHMFTQDFTPLLLGLLLAGTGMAHVTGLARWVNRTAMTVFWTFPLYFLLVKWHYLYVMAIVMIAFTWSCIRAANQIAKAAMLAANPVLAE